MTWFFAVSAGPAESWKERAREAAEQARPENATDEEISAAIELYGGHGISERDAATVRVNPVTEG